MFDWKIIVTIIVVLVVLLGYLATNPTVSGFLGDVRERVASFLTLRQSSETPFILEIDAVPNVTFSAKSVQLRIEGETDGALGASRVATNSTLGIVNFTGSITLAGTLLLDGTYASASLPDVSFAAGRAALRSSYEAAEIEGASLGALQLSGAGVLTVRGAQTSFDGAISMEDVEGSIALGEKTTVDGSASRISIPSAGITIG